MAGVAVLTSLVLGATSGLALSPLLPLIPNDLQRTRTILQALRAPATGLKVVAFGDSVIMNGIDAHLLNGEKRAAMNLSSTSQTLTESILYYQELPPSVTTVIQAVRLPLLVSGHPQSGLNPDVANAFRIYGYEPTTQTLETLKPFASPDSLAPLTENFLWRTFRARWLFRQWIDTSAREILRRDLDTRRAAFDLAFPSPYTHRLETKKLQARIHHFLVENDCGRCAIQPKALDVIAAARASCERDGRKFLLLISPVHPALESLYGDRVRGELRRAITDGQLGPLDTVIDASGALEAEDFYDEEHPSASGARKLTKIVERAIFGP